ncbi:MAG: CHAT domain-containing protein [Deltaproteobacteria bacterium]|nr:CHAT domain-containing protein [Deltaproteobacteria bacterium]
MLALTFSCRARDRAPAVASTDASTPLAVEWAGCSGVRPGPVCEVGAKRTLTIWVPGPPSKKRRIVDDRGRTIPGSNEKEVDGGTRFQFDLPAGVRQVALQQDAESAHDAPALRWSLPIREAVPHVQIDRLIALGRSGEYEKALQGLEQLRTHAKAEERGPADAAIGRMALGLGRVERAESAFRASIAAAKAEGRMNDVMRDGSALLWALLEKEQRYTEGRALLEEISSVGALYPEGRVWMDYNAGLLAANTADVRTALGKYRAAEQSATRLGCVVLAENARGEVARLLVRIGRIAEAVAIQKTVTTPDEPCVRATGALNLIWTLMALAAQNRNGKPNAELAQALLAARAAIQRCPDPMRRRLVVINEAEYALQIHDDVALQRCVKEIEALPVDRDVLRESQRGDVLGQWYLRQGRPRQALTSFGAQIPAALGAGLLEEAFRGQVGVSRALLAMGHRREAVAELKKAQQLLERMLGQIPLAEGRGAFLGGHDDGVRFLVAALVDSGNVREAFRTARWARSIELAHAARLDRLARLAPEARRRWEDALSRYQQIRAEIEHQAQDDWTVSRAQLLAVRAMRQTRAEQARATLDDAYRLLIEHAQTKDSQLSQPQVGEIYVGFFPGPDGWFAFALTRSNIVVHRVNDRAFSSLEEAARILQIFGPQLETARRVRFLPYGSADRVDWQAVPWKGRPLLSSVEVEYGLDLGTQSGRRVDADAPATALVVSNPTGDLPAATLEANGLSQTLAVDWKVTRLEGASATRAATLEALSKARLFHYAGHAQLAGLDGLSSALLLKGNGRVELGDLLTAPTLPQVVFLSACEAAGTVTVQPSLMGLAEAFIAAGSQVAIAPTRPIRDEDARIFVTAFYKEFASLAAGKAIGRGPSTEVGAELQVNFVRYAFRSAALALLQQTRNGLAHNKKNDGAGWESFRLLVP